jgi:hypothetical protein
LPFAVAAGGCEDEYREGNQGAELAQVSLQEFGDLVIWRFGDWGVGDQITNSPNHQITK